MDAAQGCRGWFGSGFSFMPAEIRFMKPSYVFLFLLWSSAAAQQPPAVGYAFPSAVPVGSSIEVQLGGYDWTPDTQFFLLNEGVTLEVLTAPSEMLFPGPPHWFGPKAGLKAFLVPREVTARITVPEGCQDDQIHWMVANANGASVSRTIQISSHPDVVEAENRDVDEPVQQLLTLPCTVCGRLKQKEEVDQYRFLAEHDGLVTCTVQSGGFGFGIYSAVRIHNAAGDLVADAADTEGTGLQATFPVKRTEAYTVTLHDIDYRGNRSMVYRLSLQPGGRILVTDPAAGQRGSTQHVTLVGYGLATGAAIVETVTREIRFPDDPNLDRFPYELETPAGTAIHHFELSDLVQNSESSGNGNTDDGRPPVISVGSAVTGRLNSNQATDEYRLTAENGDDLLLTADAQSVGSKLDVRLAILDQKDAVLASADDSNGSTDASLKFKVPADGDYRIQVSDVSGRTGQPASIYRLSVTHPEQPRFGITTPESVEVQLGDEPPEIPKKRKATRGLLYVDINPPAQSEAEMILTIDGLPDGMSAPGETVIPAGETLAAIPLATSGSSVASMATVTCRAAGHDPATAQVLVVPVMKPRAKVRPLYPDAGRTVHRGATYRAPVVVTRVEGFVGEVRLQMAAKPDRVSQGIFGAEVIVPADAQNIDFPLFLPQWVQIDRTSRIVLNTVVDVTDPAGNVRSLVNRMDQRITLNVEGTLLTVSTPQSDFPVTSGQPLQIPVDIQRSPKLRRPVIVSLVPQHAENVGPAMASAVVQADQDQTMLNIDQVPEFPASGEVSLSIKATVMDGDQVVAMSTTPVVLIAR